jgi:hypothetical protein
MASEPWGRPRFRFRAILVGMRPVVFALIAAGISGAYGCGNTSGINSGVDTVVTAFDSGLGFKPGGGSGSTTTDASASSGVPVISLTEPQTCDAAAATHSYIGCDYWPTVVANNVWSIFDFAVVVANVSVNAATVTVTGTGSNLASTNQTTTVMPGQLAKIYLPWVPALKGADYDSCTESIPFTASVLAPGGAYHLVSSVPVTVYQFNALEYQGAGGPANKSWSACPGSTLCTTSAGSGEVGCYSFSNDASLLLPSTAMTGNYRVTGHEGVDVAGPSGDLLDGPYIAITATQDNTTVKVQPSSTGQILAAVGNAIPAAPAGGVVSLTLNAGDVAELAAPGGTDLSGSLVQATAPVQVISGHPCLQIPPTEPACDHIEESVFPAETLGQDYVVTMPAAPNGAAVRHQVRIYGDVDGTTLTYNPSIPPGCPTTIDAGQVVECGTVACPNPVEPLDTSTPFECGTTDIDFEVKGSQPFAVGTFTLGASLVQPAVSVLQEGDPAQSLAIAVEQFRSTYVFLAPSDYPFNYADVVAETGTVLQLDGVTVTTSPEVIGTTGYGVYRLALGAGQAGAHTLSASLPVGLQVVGYGAYTSYMYPGGLDLAQIAAPPPPIQ